MKIGAVIAAAGRSTRMCQCKQRMKLGAFTMLQRVILNFKSAGIDEIAVVTGYQAELIEHEIWNLGVTILRNPDYAATQMFDSAKIGLSYLQHRCDKILFCPADIPLFSAATVKKLAASEEKLVIPVYQESNGHPILIASELIPEILAYEGSGGLKGALEGLGTERIRLPIEDEGILMDADTKEDFKRLEALYRRREEDLGQRPPVFLSQEEMEQLFCTYRTPEPVRKHMKAVAEFLEQILDQLERRGETQWYSGWDAATARKLLIQAALVHDLVRDRKCHAKEGARILRNMGRAEIADLVEAHHDLPEGEWNRLSPKSLLFYADKRVMEDSMVSLEERFRASRQRCKCREAIEKHERLYRQSVEIEKQLRLCDRLSEGLDDNPAAAV